MTFGALYGLCGVKGPYWWCMHACWSAHGYAAGGGRGGLGPCMGASPASCVMRTGRVCAYMCFPVSCGCGYACQHVHNEMEGAQQACKP